MTPEQWFAATDPDPLLAFVRGGPWPAPDVPLSAAVARRLMLFGCACARMVWHLMPTDSQSAVLVRERFAEGRATEADLRATEARGTWGAVTVRQHADNAAGADPAFAARGAAYALAAHASGPAPPGRPTTPEWHAAWTATYRAARATQADYARDIFPPPGYTPHLDPEWLTSTVHALARQMDESGDYSAVPILADALQDAGCDDEPVLQCCRATGNAHARGNWVVDLVLGR
jgi:hypothetical protein